VTWTVEVSGLPISEGSGLVSSRSFTDEGKAREHYTDMLMMFPLYKVELLKHKL